MKKIHVVMLSRSLPFHNVGGMEILAWNLARKLVELGISVTFITTDIIDKPQNFTSEGINVIALKNTISGKYSSSWWKASSDYFKNNLIDKVNCIFSVSAGAYGLLKFKKEIPNIQFILQAHGTSLGEIISKWKTCNIKNVLFSVRNMCCLFRDIFYYNKFDNIVAVGDAVMNQLISPPLCWFINSDCELIYNGIEISVFSKNETIRENMRHKLGIKLEDKIIISVSRLHKQKGIDYSLKGFKAYLNINKNSYYFIVGNGHDRKRLENLAIKLNIVNKVRFIGELNSGQVVDYLRAADVFLFTTVRKEAGLTLNVLEALAVGLPVVVSNHLRYESNDQKSIFYVDPRRKDEISCKIAEAVDFGLADESFLPDQYSLFFCAKKYIEFFRSLK